MSFRILLLYLTEILVILTLLSSFVELKFNTYINSSLILLTITDIYRWVMCIKLNEYG